VPTFWIKANACRLAIVPRPRGWDWLDDDIKAMRQEQIHLLISALTKSEVDELGLLEEANCCRENGISFISFPIEDRSVPASISEFESLLERIQREIRGGKAIAIHCRAGIGRSSIIVAAVLIRNGLSATEAFSAIEAARGTPVPDTQSNALGSRHSQFGTQTAAKM
jgi:protein-tyrosine phosphatase